MTVKQISVLWKINPAALLNLLIFYRNTKLICVRCPLRKRKDFGILRIIVDNPEKAAEVIQNAHYVFSVTPVLAVAIPDEPGSLSEILHTLANHDISLEIYMLLLPDKRKWLIWYSGVADNDKATKVLTDHNIKLATQEELFQI